MNLGLQEKSESPFEYDAFGLRLKRIPINDTRIHPRNHLEIAMVFAKPSKHVTPAISAKKERDYNRSGKKSKTTHRPVIVIVELVEKEPDWEAARDYCDDGRCCGRVDEAPRRTAVNQECPQSM